MQDIIYTLSEINNYIKYAYILEMIILIVILIMLLKALAKLAKASMPIVEKCENINNSLNDLNSKMEIIEHTKQTSIPFFRNIAVALALAVSVAKDFSDTKKSKRSVRKSVNKIVKYQKKIDPNFSLSKLGSSILNH